jgi:hypothetical protein
MAPMLSKTPRSKTLFWTGVTKCNEVEQAKRPNDWYAVVLRWHPEIVLVVDRCSLTRAWITGRLLLPELSSEDLAFRTMPQKEVDALRSRRL